MDKSSHPHNADGPPTDESSSSSSHYPRDIRSYFINRFNEPCYRFLYSEQMKKLLSARRIEVGKVFRLIEEEVLKLVIGHPVGLHEDLSKYHIPGESDQVMIANFPCCVNARCASYKSPSSSSPAEVYAQVRSHGDSGGGKVDTLGGAYSHSDKTIFAALAREVKEEAGQDLKEPLYPLPRRVWCKFKDGELQVHVSFPFIAVLPGGWKKKIILSEEHEEYFWIAEDAMDKYEFHGTNKAIFLETFEYMREHQTTIQ